MGVGHAHVVKGKANAELLQVRNGVEDHLVVVKGSLLGDFENDSFEGNS